MLFFAVLSLLLPKKVRTRAFEVDYYFIDFQYITIWVFKKKRDMALVKASCLLTNVFCMFCSDGQRTGVHYPYAYTVMAGETSAISRNADILQMHGRLRVRPAMTVGK